MSNQLSYWRKYGKKYRAEHKEERRAYDKMYQQRIRNAVFQLLGEECKHCGFRDKRALQVDHIYGGGNKERRCGRDKPLLLWLRILKMSHPEKVYQILCANCNWIKRHVNQEI